MSSGEAREGPWTIGRVLAWSAEFLRDKGQTDSPRLDAEVLLAHALKMTRIQLYTDFDKPLTSAERDPFKGSLKRRGGGEPVAYITGEKEFMGLRFSVGPAVLIPRPDTEVVVETILAAVAGRTAPLRILDVGTGSGCIGLALAHKLPTARVVGWDIDPQALAVARANAASLDSTMEFSQRDALSEAAWEEDGEPFDIIASNPPYISPDEAPGLPLSVRGFEPPGALFAGPDGLAFYRSLARSAPRRMATGGLLVVEIGSSQGAAVSAILAAAGWQGIVVTKDWARLDRVITAEWDHGR